MERYTGGFCTRKIGPKEAMAIIFSLNFFPVSTQSAKYPQKTI